MAATARNLRGRGGIYMNLWLELNRSKVFHAGIACTVNIWLQ